MAPKKKGNKKGNDDWESELGETVDPIAAATQEAKDAEAAAEADKPDDEANGGGLLAALKKNKSKKQKKGKPVKEDYLDGEDPPSTNGDLLNTGTDGTDLAVAKAPEEATADDLFAAAPTKAKGGKGKQTGSQPTAKEDEDESGDEGGGIKSRKEKEKEKKEREKQRKKEQVGHATSPKDSQ